MLFRKLRAYTPIVIVAAILLLAADLTGFDVKLLFHPDTVSNTIGYYYSNQHQEDNIVIFPRNFPRKVESYTQKNEALFVELGKPRVAMGEPIDFGSVLSGNPYHYHQISAFKGNTTNVSVGCEDSKNTVSVGIDEAVSLTVSLKDIMKEFYKQCEHNQYYEEVSQFMINTLETQLDEDKIEKHYFRMAGSSVWLEEYGVYYTISRVLFSPSGTRNAPIVSMLYAQLYDRDWNELKNTKLVVPTQRVKEDHMEDDDEDVEYKVETFPMFLSVPFWHDVDDTEGKFYGPEDPRLLLVRNKDGYEEPLVIFNAYHRKLIHDTDAYDGMNYKFYRSIFYCWPWKHQRGKENVDGVPDVVYKEKLYTKVTELRIDGLDRFEILKNWSPFVSEKSKGFDSHINFIFRLQSLEVLKCDLFGRCKFVYRMDTDMATDEPVGELRGGSELININKALRKVTKVLEIIPPNREIWFGFARAHLQNCGCGPAIYRPNLIVLVKDTVEVNVETDGYISVERKDMYKLAYVSSYISFDIPIIGWDLSNPYNKCGGPNVLIPNGLSNFVISSFGIRKGELKWGSEDYVSLFLSISDVTVHKMNIKGLLNAILEVSNGYIFKEPHHEAAELMKVTMGLPTSPLSYEEYRHTDELGLGYDNFNVECALQGSREFCAAYGAEEKLGSLDALLADFLESSQLQ